MCAVLMLLGAIILRSTAQEVAHLRYAYMSNPPGPGGVSDDNDLPRQSRDWKLVIAYFSDVWNLNDLLLLVLFISIVAMATTSTDPDTSWAPSLNAVAALHGFLTYLKTLDLMRPLRYTGALVRMLLQIMSDMRYFLIILGTITVGSSFLFYGLNAGGDELGVGYWYQLFNMYQAFVLGAFEASALESVDQTVSAHVAYVRV